jgi:nucleotide-binding universal stress UspA family protein
VTSSILLLVPPDRQVTGAISTALDLAAARRADLIAAIVIDADASLRLASRMIDVGLLAEKITDQVLETLAREHRIRGEALLRDIVDQAQARGITCRTAIETGDTDEVCRRFVEQDRISAAVVVTEKRSWIARLVTAGQPLRPPALGGCELVLVGED